MPSFLTTILGVAGKKLLPKVVDAATGAAPFLVSDALASKRAKRAAIADQKRYDQKEKVERIASSIKPSLSDAILRLKN